MEIDEQFEMVNEKIELLSKASNNFNALKTRFFQFAFALIINPTNPINLNNVSLFEKEDKGHTLITVDPAFQALEFL